MVSSKLRVFTDPYISNLAKPLARTGINPSFITLFGLSFSIIAGIMYAKHNLIFASLALIFSSLFDVADGAVARLNKQVSAFGGFFDSLSDRYSDAVVLIGIALYLENHYLLVFVVLIGSYLVSYSRARAELEIKKCDVGIGERAERLVILIVATIIQASNIIMANAIYWALIVLAVITHFTVIQRIWYTYNVLEK